EVVAAFIAALEWARAPDVADGVDAPCQVVNEEDAYHAAPERAQEHARPRHREQSSQRGGDEQADEDPERKELARGPDHRILAQIADVADEAGRALVEDPADVGVPEAADDAEEAGSLGVRRMRIVVLIAVLMVATMDRGPLEDRAFSGHA